jgi:hypothetical protein
VNAITAEVGSAWQMPRIPPEDSYARVGNSQLTNTEQKEEGQLAERLLFLIG